MTRIVSFLIACLSIASCDIKSAKDYFAEAERLENQEKYKEAIPLLDKAILKDKKYIGAYINRGADKAALGDFSGAINDYNTVISIDPKNTLAYFNIGNNLMRLGDNKSAIVFFNKAFATKGGDGVYLDLQANSILDLSSFDIPGYEIYYARGIAFYQVDSLKKAYTDFQHCISNNFMIAESYYWIGNIFLKNGNKSKACENFSKSHSLGDKQAAVSIEKYCN